MYAIRLPWLRLEKLTKLPMRSIIQFFQPFLNIISKTFPGFNNNFAFVVIKAKIPDNLHPWLKQTDDKITLNREWFASNYEK